LVPLFFFQSNTWCFHSNSVTHPAEAVGFLKGDKNPQHTFLWKGSKIIGPMSQNCGMLKNPGYISQASSGCHFRP
jgi:hypothetical protein